MRVTDGKARNSADMERRVKNISLLRAKGLVDREIAEKLHLTQNQIKHACAAYGAPRARRGRPVNKDLLRALLRLDLTLPVKERAPLREVAEAVGCSFSAVKYYRKRVAELGKGWRKHYPFDLAI